MNTLLGLGLNTLSVFIAGYILPGITISNVWVALVVAVVLGILNTFVRPILLVLTLPLNVLTLGLFTFVIMGFMVWLVSAIVPGFEVRNFWWCMLFALVLTIINSVLSPDLTW